ncbi:hypothetical protein EC973_005763 [Apophysomyces ossiformis]|uniref:Uncharacterized protein n=1 Tax=Apophysomyces ossiformis TaxID=679940 RepID=A0A8H7BJ03_9FUNG|nr:hypothetical protein EC973_005763 [Apophysomyces ossiformis]
MDNIYRRAKRIIAAPDLCYCDEYPYQNHVTKHDIAFLHGNSLYRHGENILLEDKQSEASQGTRINLKMIREWPRRCWVISERTIGVKDNKLDIIILSANGAKIPYWQSNTLLHINWIIDFTPSALIDAIINSGSSKYIDRLYAILPHTKYKDAVSKLVDEDKDIKSIMDLKMTLLDILDSEGKNGLLWQMISFDNDFQSMLPTFADDQEPEAAFIYANQEHYCKLEATLQDGKPAVKVSGYYSIKSYPTAHLQLNKLIGVQLESVVDILLVRERRGYFSNLWQQCLRCGQSNGIWLVDSIVNEVVSEDEHYKRGEFILF